MMASSFPDPPKPMPDLVTVQEFAEQYRVDASVVRNWIKRGYISYVLDGPRKMRKIRKSDAIKPLEPAPAPVVINHDIELGEVVTEINSVTATTISTVVPHNPEPAKEIRREPAAPRPQVSNHRGSSRR